MFYFYVDHVPVADIQGWIEEMKSERSRKETGTGNLHTYISTLWEFQFATRYKCKIIDYNKNDLISIYNTSYYL